MCAVRDTTPLTTVRAMKIIPIVYRNSLEKHENVVETLLRHLQLIFLILCSFIQSQLSLIKTLEVVYEDDYSQVRHLQVKHKVVISFFSNASMKSNCIDKRQI